MKSSMTLLILSLIFILQSCGGDGSALELIAANNPSTTPTTPATPDTSVSTIIMFNASTNDGDLGGRSGADTICSTAKPTSITYTNVRAFISISAADEIRDFPTIYSVPTTLAIESTNATTLATDWASLLDGDIDSSLSAAGVLPTSQSWWTGTTVTATGIFNASNNCSGYTDNGFINGQRGSSDSTATDWMGLASTGTCNSSLYVLCIAWE